MLDSCSGYLGIVDVEKRNEQFLKVGDYRFKIKDSVWDYCNWGSG